MVRIEPDRFVVVADGLVELTLVVIGVPAPAVRADIIVVEADRVAIATDCFFKLPLLAIGISATDVGSGIFGVEPDRLVKIIEGLIVLRFAKSG
jgi:hypothetical protein